MFFNEVLNMSNRDKNLSNSRAQEMQRFSTRQGQKYALNSNQLRQLQTDYVYNLLKTWKRKALNVRSSYPTKLMNNK